MQTSCTELTLLTFFKKGELFQGDSIQRGILIQEIRYWQFLKELFKLRQIGYHFKKWNSNVGVSFFVLLHSCKAIRKNIFAMLARSQKSLMRLYAFFNYLFNQKHSTNSVTFSIKVEKILKGSLDSISSPSMKIQIMGEKVCLRCKGKTLQCCNDIAGQCQQTFCIQKFVDIMQQQFAFTPFPPII